MSEMPLTVDSMRLQLAQEIKRVLASDFSVQEIFGFIERPPEQKLGDYALPCFRFAKALKTAPPKIAAKLKEELADAGEWLEEVEVVGAFANFRVNKSTALNTIASGLRSGEFFSVFSDGTSREKVMIEYSQPNTHKDFHVGHVRNLCLGDTVCRLYRFCGYPVIAANYFGDEGTHIAKCLWYLNKNKLEPPESERGRWLGEIYQKASAYIGDAQGEDKDTINAEVSATLKEIESKEGPTFELWRDSKEWSLESFKEIYQWFDAGFDRDFYESEVSAEAQAIVDEFYQKKIFVLSEGAIGADLNEHDLGFLLLRKRDGNTLYATKDLALAREKFDRFNIEKSIYVVGSEQNLHFRQVFKTLELMGFERAKDCFHLNYGLVMLPEGKMSSRAGTIISFWDLKNDVEAELEKILTKYEDWSEAEKAAAAHKLAVGAVRYGMLATDPVRDVVFNLSDWLSFEGQSGPYLMYSYARARSILRKAETETELKMDDADLSLMKEEAEQELVRWLMDFPQVVWQAAHLYRPSMLAHYLYDMSRCYNRFYSNCPVLAAQTERLGAARLVLIDCFSKCLKQGLSLLGIATLERM